MIIRNKRDDGIFYETQGIEYYLGTDTTLTYEYNFIQNTYNKQINREIKRDSHLD